MRYSCVTAAIGLALPLSALAQEAPGEDVQPPGDGPAVVSLIVENDFFDVFGQHTDRYYTNGIKGTLVFPEGAGRDWIAFFNGIGVRPDDDRARTTRFSLSLGQNIYTPEDLTLTSPNPLDRPYAGYLYVAPGIVTASPSQLNTVELQVGIVGPSAYAGPAQNWLHDQINGQHVMGWDRQLRDEVTVNLAGERRMAPRVLLHRENGEPMIDLTESYTAAIGTVETSVGAGGTLRLGMGLENDYGHARLRAGGSTTEYMPIDGESLYLFAGAHGRLIARDIFLDGNTFLDSPSVDKDWFVFEGTAGLVFRYRRWRVAYTHVWRGEEFKGQRGGAAFGAITFTYTFKDGSRTQR